MKTSIEVELFRREKPLWEYATEIGIPYDRLKRIIRGQVKGVPFDEVTRIAGPVNLDPAELKREIEERAQARRVQQAQADD